MSNAFGIYNSNALAETADPEGSDSIDGDDNPDGGEDPEGAVVIRKKTYRYTRSGDLMRIRDDLKGVTYDYAYDGLHRLTVERRTDARGTATTDTYGYDGIGNLTSKRTGNVQLVYAYDSSRPHAVRSVKNGGKTHYFTYDANGNLTYGPDLTDSSSVGWRSLSWTAENRPSEIKYKDKKTVPLTIRFEYDGEGRRTVKTVSVPTLSTGGNIDPKAVSTTVYVNDSFQVANGKAVVHLFAGTVRIAEVRSGSVLYHHKDHLGSATVLTDKNGSRVETAEYLPFGELRESTGSWTTDYKFTDHELDTETGLYNFNARLYDPAVGRFISPDPAVPDLSNSKNPWNYDPQMLNRYAYCRNNPLIYVDPTGLVMEDAGDDDDQYGEGPSAGGSGNGRDADGTAAGQSGRNASQTGPGEDEESDTPGKSRKGDKGTTVVGWCDLGIDNPLDNPPGQMVRDEDGNYTYVNPQGPNRNWGKIATGSLMYAAGLYTTVVSGALYGIAAINFRLQIMHGVIEGLHAAYIGGIHTKPGLFMMNKGKEIVKEGWRGE